MYIVNQNRTAVFNVYGLWVEDNKILTVGSNVYGIVGQYDTEERTNEVFADILDVYFPPINLKNEISDDEWEAAQNDINRPLVRGTVESERKIDFSNMVYYMPRE